MFPADRCQFGEELQNLAAVSIEQKVEDQNPDYLNQQVAGSPGEADGGIESCIDGGASDKR